MKKSAFLLVLAAGTVLAGCGNKEQKPVDHNVYSFEYAAKYKVDVISEKGGFENFKQDVDDVTKGEIDLTEGNLYMHVVRNGKDGAKVTKNEALVYKVESDYFYLTNTMGEAKKLADEAAAKAKINELLVKVSHNKAGDVSLSTAVYEKGVYEHREFGLNTGNIKVDEFLPLDYKDEKGHVTGTFDYIGYNTDAGVSDFPGRDGAGAATYTLDYADGYVSSWTENIAASLEMPIMTPAPTVKIDGTRSYKANYGAEYTKLATIDHQITKAKVVCPDTDKGKVEVFTCKDKTAEKVAIVKEGEANVGELLALKVTPAGANTILRVTNNATSLETPEADGFFYFEVQEGVNKLGVNFNGSDVNADAKIGTLVEPADKLGCAIQYFTCKGETDVKNMVEANPKALTVGNWLCVKVAPKDDTQKVKSVTCNGKAAMGGKEMFGYWVFVIVEGENKIELTLEAAVAPSAATLALPTLPAGVSLTTLTCAPFAFQNMVPADPTNLVVGNWLCVKPTLPAEPAQEAYIVLNGKDPLTNPAQAGGFWCFNIAEGENKLEIVVAETAKKATIALPADLQGCTLVLRTFKGKDFMHMTTVSSKGFVPAGDTLAVKVIAPEGKTATVQCNGKDAYMPAANAGGFYCFIATAGENAITFTLA